MSHLLSKSKYIRGLQCDRALWLDVFNPRLARYTAEQMRRFDRGREFEYSFKNTFPNGIDISAELKRNVDAYPERTAQLLDGTGQSPFTSHLSPLTLFEAGFLYDDVLVLADVVHKNADGTLDIYEVKSGNALSESDLSDSLSDDRTSERSTEHISVLIDSACLNSRINVILNELFLEVSNDKL